MMLSVFFFWVCLFAIISETAAYLSPLSSCRTTKLHPLNIFYQADAVDCPTATSTPISDIPDPLLSRSAFFFASAAAFAALSLSATVTNAVEETAKSPGNFDGTLTTSKDFVSNLPSNVISAEESTTSLQESISGFVAGGALTATKTLVKYPLDTVTVRLQVPSAEYSLSDLGSLFRGSYNGVTLSLLSNIPAGAVFFAVKDATKASLKTAAWASAAPKWVTTTLAVGAALIPYWLVRNPSEVIKVRQQAGIAGYGEGVSALDAIRLTFNETAMNGGSTLDAIQTFYTGYWENIIYGLPADVIKFVAYEAFTGGRRDLSPLEGAQAGAFATAAAQLLTTPLDVIRNRLMSGTDNKGQENLTSQSDGKAPKAGYMESLIRLGREEGLTGLFAGATPRVAKAFLSGAIQFATYEETKTSISRILQRK